MTEPELRARLPRLGVFARVTAEHKLRIVRAFQAAGQTVAMTGDGVNDAPALKGADIGIAMGKSGTGVTKQAADIIITDDNFSTIVSAVEEGRGIYDNIRKTLQYLLAGNAGELLLMAAAVVAGLPAPLVPVHLLWINLVTDGLPALCLAGDPIDPDVMTRRPRRQSQSLTDAAFLRTLFITGTLTGGVAFATFFRMLQTSSIETARTYAFAVLVCAELLRAFGARSERRPVWKVSMRSNLPLLGVVLASLGLQVLAQQSTWFGRVLKTTPIPFIDCAWILLIGSIPLLAMELLKPWLNRLNTPTSPHRGLHHPASAEPAPAAA